MSAFFLATITAVHNPEKFAEYGQKASSTFAPFGGEVVARGKKAASLAGELNVGAVALIKFPDLASINQWYESADYQALVPLREEAVTMAITAFEALI